MKKKLGDHLQIKRLLHNAQRLPGIGIFTLLKGFYSIKGEEAQGATGWAHKTQIGG